MRRRWLPGRLSRVHPFKPGPTMDIPKRRRSDRILVPLRILVSGVDAVSKPFQEEAVTVSVNKHGACISLLRQLLPDQKLSIRNLENDVEAEFRVVGELRQVFGERREWGVETLCPECNIWGLDFEQPPDHVQPKALICCSRCGNGSLSSLSSIEYDVLLAAGGISRHCESCGETTRWQPGQMGSDLAPGTSPAPPRVDERRKHRRVRLSMLVRVRDSQGESAVAQTLDVSKGGALFLSRRRHHAGDILYLTLPSTDKPAPVESRARVVRTQMTEHGTLYAVKFESA
jgi:PilZ domain